MEEKSAILMDSVLFLCLPILLELDALDQEIIDIFQSRAPRWVGPRTIPLSDALSTLKKGCIGRENEGLRQDPEGLPLSLSVAFPAN